MRVYKSNWMKIYRAVWYSGGKTAGEYAAETNLKAEYRTGYRNSEEGTAREILQKLKNAGLVVNYWEFPGNGARRERWKATGRRLEKKELLKAWEEFGKYTPFL